MGCGPRTHGSPLIAHSAWAWRRPSACGLFILLLILATVAFGAAVQGSLGIGMALIAAPILLLLDPRLVPGPFLVAVLCITVLMTRREWRHMKPASIAWVCLGGIPGTVIGAWVTATVATGILGGVLGLLIVAAVGVSVLGHRVRPSKMALVAAGGVSGFMASIVSIGGPPLALLLQDRPGEELRGTLAGYFTLSSLAVLAGGGVPVMEARCPSCGLERIASS